MLVRIVDAKGNDNLVKEGNVGKHRTPGPQIGTGMKDKIIPPDGKCIAVQKR